MKMLTTNYNILENKTYAITIAEDIVEELNSYGYDEIEDVYQYVWDDLEARTIYYEDQWNLMKNYQTPNEANYNEAFIECYSEICSIIEEDDDEDEEDESNNF